LLERRLDISGKTARKRAQAVIDQYNADKQSAYRQRKRDGLSQLRVNVDMAALVEFLSRDGGELCSAAMFRICLHLVNKAMAHAPDVETQRAYIVVLEHTERRLDHSLTANKLNPTPKSA
jgi:hypothetical protein